MEKATKLAEKWKTTMYNETAIQSEFDQMWSEFEPSAESSHDFEHSVGKVAAEIEHCLLLSKMKNHMFLSKARKETKFSLDLKLANGTKHVSFKDINI